MWGWAFYLPLLFDLLLRVCFDSAVATIREHLVAVSERPRGGLFVSIPPLWQEHSGWPNFGSGRRWGGGMGGRCEWGQLQETGWHRDPKHRLWGRNPETLPGDVH